MCCTYIPGGFTDTNSKEKIHHVVGRAGILALNIITLNIMTTTAIATIFKTGDGIILHWGHQIDKLAMLHEVER